MNELQVYLAGTEPQEANGFRDVLVTEAFHPFWEHWWPQGHIIGWEHTFVHELAHFLDAVVNDKEVGPYGATFEDGYKNAVVCDAIVRSAREGRRVEIAYERSPSGASAPGADGLLAPGGARHVPQQGARFREQALVREARLEAPHGTRGVHQAGHHPCQVAGEAGVDAPGQGPAGVLVQQDDVVLDHPVLATDE